MQTRSRSGPGHLLHEQCGMRTLTRSRSRRRRRMFEINFVTVAVTSIRKHAAHTATSAAICARSRFGGAVGGWKSATTRTLRAQLGQVLIACMFGARLHATRPLQRTGLRAVPTTGTQEQHQQHTEWRKSANVREGMRCCSHIKANRAKRGWVGPN